MTGNGLPAGNGRAHAVHGAMLAVMAACPPAQPVPCPAEPGQDNGQQPNSQTVLHSAQHNIHSTVSSPLGQVRAMAWLMGIQKPALATSTCSRIAAGVASRRSFYDAMRWLLAAGFTADAAAHVAGLVWPSPQVPAGGAGEGAVVGRVGLRRRPEDVGSGAAGTTPV